MSNDLKDLVKRCQDGDEDAAARIITIHKQLIFTVVYRMTGDQDLSMDLCQETFIKAFRNIHKLKDPGRIRSWLCSIARNRTYDHLRRRKRGSNVSIEEIGEVSVPDPSSGIRKKMIMQKALQKLNERDRLLLTLFYYKGHDLKELAVMTGIKESNVKVSLSRARQKLRRELEGYENELLS